MSKSCKLCNKDFLGSFGQAGLPSPVFLLSSQCLLCWQSQVCSDDVNKYDETQTIVRVILGPLPYVRNGNRKISGSESLKESQSIITGDPALAHYSSQFGVVVKVPA